MKTNLLDIRNGDCMDLMREAPDNHWDLAIVDPPYGIGAEQMNLGGGYGERWTQRGRLSDVSGLSGGHRWDFKIPGNDYFQELFRVSCNQVIWGGNYFELPPTRGVIAWDKVQPWENFSAWEMAWTSFDAPAALFRMSNHLNNRGKIHPTQKPVQLYSWLLAKYAKPGDRILDTHMGSGSIAVACHFAGFRLTATELDGEYYRAACERIRRETAQAELFQPTECTKLNQGELLT